MEYLHAQQFSLLHKLIYWSQWLCNTVADIMVDHCWLGSGQAFFPPVYILGRCLRYSTQETHINECRVCCRNSYIFCILSSETTPWIFCLQMHITNQQKSEPSFNLKHLSCLLFLSPSQTRPVGTFTLHNIPSGSKITQLRPVSPSQLYFWLPLFLLSKCAYRKKASRHWDPCSYLQVNENWKT